jgi:hypothetical protein
MMDIGEALIELREELEILPAAIANLERLRHVGPRKRAAAIRRPARIAVRREGPRRVAGLRKAE